MINYEKPVILTTEGLAEGVYAASGSKEPGSAKVSSVKLTQEGNQWNKVNTYKVTIQNTGNEDLTEWSVSISVTAGTASSATIYNGWLASASLNGSKITITPGGGGTIVANGSIDVEVVVGYSSDSLTVQ